MHKLRGIIEQTFTGPLHEQLRAALRYIRNTILTERVVKHPDRFRAIRRYAPVEPANITSCFPGYPAGLQRLLLFRLGRSCGMADESDLDPAVGTCASERHSVSIRGGMGKLIGECSRSSVWCDIIK